jgi:hypothetical protein
MRTGGIILYRIKTIMGLHKTDGTKRRYGITKDHVAMQDTVKQGQDHTDQEDRDRDRGQRALHCPKNILEICHCRNLPYNQQ